MMKATNSSLPSGETRFEPSMSATNQNCADEVLASNGSKIVPLRAPSTNCLSYFMLNHGTKELYEIQGFDEKYRSWFIDGSVHSDGCIKIATPYNPVFLILPFLMKTTKNVPLDHLLQDDEFPCMASLADFVDDLTCVADRKGPENLGVWSYNEEKTLEWLSEKVDKLAEALQEARERPSMACAFASDKDSYRVLAYGILSECVCVDLSTKLKNHLNLPQPEKENTRAEDENRQTKKMRIDEVSPDNYNKQQKKPVVKQSAKEKALAKSAKGSKSITSFFSKK